MKKSTKSMFLMIVFSIIITVSMIITGCQPSTPGESDVSSSDETQSTSAEATPTPEPVVLTMIAPAFESTFAAGFQDDPVMKEIERITGVKLDITPANAIADMQARLTSLMASRDLPDIVYVEDNNIKKQIVTSQLALDLDPYMDKLDNFKTNKPLSLDLMRQRFSVDIDGEAVDGLYFLGLGGTLGNPYRPTAGFYVRWDLYEQLGYPEINSYDDYIPLMQEMLKLEPENKDGKQNYGLSAWFGQGAAFGIWPIANPFYFDSGIMITTSNEFDFDNDETSPSLTDPESLYWTGVEWWNKAYRAGLIDPDAFVQTWPDYLERIDSENRAMIAFADFAIQGGETAFINDGTPEKGYVVLPSTRTDKKTYVTGVYEPVGNRHFCIAANSENPERAIEFMNYLASWDATMLIYNGIKGQDWDVADGVPGLKDETITGMLDDSDFSLKTGINKYHNLAGLGEIDRWPEYDVPAKLRYMPDVFNRLLKPAEKKAVEYYEVQYPMQIVTEGKSNFLAGMGERYLNYVNLPPMEQKFNDINAEMNKIMMEDVFEAIMAKTEAEFQTQKNLIINKAVRLGGNELYEERARRFYGE